MVIGIECARPPTRFARLLSSAGSEPWKGSNVRIPSVVAPLLVCLLATTAIAEIDWRRDIRQALDEAEDRGVPVLLYFTRDT